MYRITGDFLKVDQGSIGDQDQLRILDCRMSYADSQLHQLAAVLLMCVQCMQLLNIYCIWRIVGKLLIAYNMYKYVVV